MSTTEADHAHDLSASLDSQPDPPPADPIAVAGDDPTTALPLTQAAPAEGPPRRQRAAAAAAAAGWAGLTPGRGQRPPARDDDQETAIGGPYLVAAAATSRRGQLPPPLVLRPAVAATADPIEDDDVDHGGFPAVESPAPPPLGAGAAAAAPRPRLPASRSGLRRTYRARRPAGRAGPLRGFAPLAFTSSGAAAWSRQAGRLSHLEDVDHDSDDIDEDTLVAPLAGASDLAPPPPGLDLGPAFPGPCGAPAPAAPQLRQVILPAAAAVLTPPAGGAAGPPAPVPPWPAAAAGPAPPLPPGPADPAAAAPPHLQFLALAPPPAYRPPWPLW